MLKSVGIVFGRLPLLPEALSAGLQPDLRANFSCVDDHDHPQYSVIKAEYRSEKDLQAFSGTLAQLRQEFPVVFEIDPEQDRDAEDKLAVRHWIENVVEDIFPELNHSVKNPKIRHPK